MWAVPWSDLDSDQRAAAELSFDRHRIVSGGPGTGKTLILGHRAARLLEDGIAPERIRVLAYNRVLRSFVKDGMMELGIPESCVLGFSSWTIGLHRRLLGPTIPMVGAHPDFDAVARAVRLELETRPGPPPFKALLVDEGQDLSEESAQLLAVAAEHVTVAIDEHQQLYGGVDTRGLCEILEVPVAAISLLSGFRCTAGILALARCFQTEAEVTATGSSRALPSQGFEEFPLVQCFASDTDELTRLAMLLKARAVAGQSSLVVVPYVAEIDRLARALRERDLDVMAQGEDLDFGANWPIITTYHSAKGLTFDAVFLPGMTASRLGTYDDLGPRLRANLTYTALTRASRWAWIGVRDGDHVPELAPEVLDRLQRSGNVSIERCGAGSGSDDPRMHEGSGAQAPRPVPDAGVFADLLHG